MRNLDMVKYFASFIEDPKSQKYIQTVNDGINEAAQILHELLKNGKTHVGVMDASASEIAEKLTKLNEWADRDTDGTPRRDFGNCRCTHPPSFGRCIFGACVTVFKYGLKITINI